MVAGPGGGRCNACEVAYTCLEVRCSARATRCRFTVSALAPRRWRRRRHPSSAERLSSIPELAMGPELMQFWVPPRSQSPVKAFVFAAQRQSARQHACLAHKFCRLPGRCSALGRHNLVPRRANRFKHFIPHPHTKDAATTIAHRFLLQHTFTQGVPGKAAGSRPRRQRQVLRLLLVVHCRQ